jgi:hypothetical protein
VVDCRVNQKGIDCAMPPRIIKQPGDASLQLKIAFKAELREKIIEAATKAHRSMTAEVIYRLEQSYEAATPTFDFSYAVRELITWYYVAKHPDAELDKTLDEIMVDFLDALMEAREADRLKFLGRFLSARLEDERKKPKK